MKDTIPPGQGPENARENHWPSVVELPSGARLTLNAETAQGKTQWWVTLHHEDSPAFVIGSGSVDLREWPTVSMTGTDLRPPRPPKDR